MVIFKKLKMVLFQATNMSGRGRLENEAEVEDWVREEHEIQTKDTGLSKEEPQKISE